MPCLLSEVKSGCCERSCLGWVSLIIVFGQSPVYFQGFSVFAVRETLLDSAVKLSVAQVKPLN